MDIKNTSHGAFPPGVGVRNSLQPGDIGYLVYLHGVLYAKECGWDHTFEAYVASPLAGFGRSRTQREQIWIVEKKGIIVGSIAIVAASQEKAQLRWLLLHPNLRGLGIGRLLVEKALQFCRECGYHSVFLWTESKLTAAAKLYKSVGFQLTEEKTHQLWGAVVTEQRYDLKLD
jgi:N-acetylglutamate synthase-like GNAT family acetyltransferase